MFWSATFHDFTTALLARKDAAEPQRQEMTPAATLAMLDRRVTRQG